MNNEKKKTRQAETLREVVRRLGRYRIFLVFSVLLAAVSVALTLYIPKLTGNAVDYIISKEMWISRECSGSCFRSGYVPLSQLWPSG